MNRRSRKSNSWHWHPNCRNPFCRHPPKLASVLQGEMSLRQPWVASPGAFLWQHRLHLVVNPRIPLLGHSYQQCLVRPLFGSRWQRLRNWHVQMSCRQVQSRPRLFRLCLVGNELIRFSVQSSLAQLSVRQVLTETWAELVLRFFQGWPSYVTPVFHPST